MTAYDYFVIAGVWGLAALAYHGHEAGITLLASVLALVAAIHEALDQSM